MLPEKWKPYPAYKPSGVAWLGDIPAHWEVRRLKFLARLNMGQSPSSEDYNRVGEGLPFLQGNAEFGLRHPTARLYCTTARKHAQPGDILLSVRAPVGALNVADQIYGIGRGLCAVRLNPRSLDPVYAIYLLSVVRVELNIVATGSTYEAVAVDQVGSLRCVVPPLAEQQAIAAFLDREAGLPPLEEQGAAVEAIHDGTAKVDVLLVEIRQGIERLKEYRVAVISAAVTGKIDVRGEVA